MGGSISVCALHGVAAKFSQNLCQLFAVRGNLYSAGMDEDKKMRTDDGYIIYECLNGKPEAFGMLVDKYKAGIYAFVYVQVGDFHNAQDVTQEVFIHAYRNLSSLRRWESFTSWLYRIASRRCKLWIRAQSRRVDRDFIEDQHQRSLEVDSMNSYSENQLSEDLQEAINTLPDTHREVLMLHYFGGMTIKDMARAIGASPAAIAKRLSRARVQLREEMVVTMDTAFEGQRLQASFTLRIVEAVRRIKINPMPRMAGLPWGLSLAMGIIITVLSLNPQMNTTRDIAIPAGSPLPIESEGLRIGEIPVGILKTDEISVIASKQENGDVGAPRDEFMLSPRQDEGGTWTKKGEMPTARWAPATCVVDGKIYAIGGIGGPKKVEEYDPATDTWTKKADMPTGRAFLGASVVDGKIYAIGGGTALKGGTKPAAVEEYDPATDTWTKKSDMPVPIDGLSTSVVNGKIYAIGGFVTGGGGGEITVSTVEEYDPATDTWTKKADMPTARGLASTSVVNGKIYVVGGVTTDAWPAFSTVEEYDPVTDTWTKKADMPAPSTSSTSVVDGKIYAFGGVDRRGGDPLSTLFQYDPATDTWAAKDDMTVRMSGMGTSVVDGRIYVIGGTSAGFPYTPGLSTVWEYDPGFALVPAEEARSVEPKGKLIMPWGRIRSK